jgi:uncharacterized delta-60 repeat protein
MPNHFKAMLWGGMVLALIVSLFGLKPGPAAADAGDTFFSLDDGLTALAGAGGLDTAFSGDGGQITDFGGSEEAHDVAVQADGKIVAVGGQDGIDFVLARYNPNGSLDRTFSGDGRQLTDFGGGAQAWGVAIRSDGKIVVTGEKCENGNGTCDLAVGRYNANGSPDTTFSGDGQDVIDLGVSGSTNPNGVRGNLAIQSDGKIVVAGYLDNGSDIDFAVIRLNADGGLDPSFGGTGIVSFGFGPGRQDFGQDLVMQNSKVVVAGYTCDPGGSPCDFALARLTSGGAPDPTFSADGLQTTDFGGEEYAWGIARQSDGKLVVAGQKFDGTKDVFAVARYNGNGSLDTTFNGNGKRTVGYRTNYARALDVRVQGNGKIVLAGEVLGLYNQGFAIARLNPGGGLDKTFSGDGKAAYSYGMNDCSGQALMFQKDGKYLIAGYVQLSTGSDFAVIRILP